MIVRNLISTLVCGLCVLASSIGFAAPIPEGVGDAKATLGPTQSGVVGRIDSAINHIVINDMVYSYSPLTLVVHRSGHTSGVTSLQPNQKVRFIFELGMRGSGSSPARVVKEIWVDKN